MIPADLLDEMTRWGITRLKAQPGNSGDREGASVLSPELREVRYGD